MDDLNKVWNAYLNGTASQTDKKYLLDVLENEKENELTIYLNKLWDENNTEVVRGQTADEELFQIIKQQIKPKKETKIIHYQFRRNILGFTAAACMIALMGMLFWLYLPKGEEPNQWVQLELKAGEEAKEFVLPDGSNVWLNAATTLSYANNFKINRQVKLSGEAYFEVAKNKSVPFNVTFGNNELLVTGTQFNIKAYPTGKICYVHVKEGSVSVLSPNDTSKLVQNNYLTLNNASGKQSKSEIDFETLQGWTRGQMIFNNSPFDEVLMSIERHYGVNILKQKTSNNKEKPITAIYPINTKLKDVMIGLQYLQGMKYEFISSDSLIVSF